MRLAGQAKMGYYPTPLSQVALIAPWLEASPRGLSRAVEPRKPVRLLDPCAGAGEALETLAQAMASPDVPAYAVPEALPVPIRAFYFTPTSGEDYAHAIAWEGFSVPGLVRGQALSGESPCHIPG